MNGILHTSENDVFVAGKRQVGDSWEMVVWKNNKILTVSPTQGTDLMIPAIAVSHNNVMVTGSIVYRNDNASVYSDATLWQNGVASTLPNGADGVNVYFGRSLSIIK